MLHMSESTTLQVGINTPTTCFLGSASPVMRTVEAIALEIAATNIPVLIMGESGTGKQALARHIHEMSPEREKPIVQIRCGALAPEKIASEIPTRRNGGSVGAVIFDEVGDLDRESQRKLLHILPDGQDTSEERVSARMISTSTQNLENEIRAGHFRSDLYYRLNGVCLKIPPLRERREDIEPLLELFLERHACRFGKQAITLNSAAIKRLVEHPWTGNIRELENVAMKILALGDEQIALNDLCESSNARRESRRADIHSCSLKAAARAASREAERELILKALSRTQWNRKRAAQELQISYKSLLYKLKQIGVADSESE